MKFDMNQKNFNLELEHEYKIKKYLSCGVAKFCINVASTKEILIEEYKYSRKAIRMMMMKTMKNHQTMKE